jgi:hypothetical protein
MDCRMAVSNLVDPLPPERVVLLEANLRSETIDTLNREGWPVGEIHKLWPAGESDYNRDTVLFVTPGGVPMTALLGVGWEGKPLKPMGVIDSIWEGWN